MTTGTWTRWIWGCATVAVIFVGCAGASSTDGRASDSAGAAGESAGGGGDVAVGGPGGAGEGGAETRPARPTEIERLEACAAEPPCGRSFAQLIEGSQQYIDTPGTVCLLEALRDRKPGLYVHEADATDTANSRSEKHFIVVNGSAEVPHAIGSHFSAYDGSSTSSVRGERCRLKPASYFDACAKAVAGAEDELGYAGAANDAWDCVFGSPGTAPGPMPWFESCEGATQLSCDAPRCGGADSECCEDEPLPCQGLSEAECSTLEQCEPIRGKPYRAGDLDGEGGSAAAPFDDYLGCRSACRGPGGDAISCTFDPAAPSDCYMIGTTAGPDGWTEVFECGFESGQCGTP
jgi:hypothetical protein